MTKQEQIDDIQKRLDNEEELSDKECLILLSAATGIPLEILEYRKSVIREEELLHLECDLPMRGEWEDDSDFCED